VNLFFFSLLSGPFRAYPFSLLPPPPPPAGCAFPDFVLEICLIGIVLDLTPPSSPLPLSHRALGAGLFLPLMFFFASFFPSEPLMLAARVPGFEIFLSLFFLFPSSSILGGADAGSTLTFYFFFSLSPEVRISTL